jgi:hypothetical protein
MDESAFGENRRAVLQLYQNILTADVTIMLAVAVGFLTEVQLIGAFGKYWPILLFLIVVTIWYGFDRLSSVLYWNRRIQYITTTEILEVPNGRDSMKWLDLFYWDQQNQKEKDLWYRWYTNVRIKPKVGDNSLDYLKSKSAITTETPRNTT